ncbi:MAG: pinensin family lanthipeptide [Bacteroidota bacterium]
MKKLKINELQVKSFITEAGKVDANTVKGGISQHPFACQLTNDPLINCQFSQDPAADCNVSQGIEVCLAPPTVGAFTFCC